MRETTRSVDDVAVDAAKEKLSLLRTRPGFEQAMKPEPVGSRSARWVAIVFALGFVALAIASFGQVSTTWLRWVLVLLFGAFAVIATLAAIGFGPDPTPEPTPAVVVDKAHDPDKNDHTITLLDDTGTQREITALEGVWTALRAGDVGVAHVRPGPYPMLVEFHRL